MKFRILVAGRRRDKQVDPMIEEYLGRTKAYVPTEFIRQRDMAGLRESAKGLAVVMDERGKQWSTRELSNWVEQRRDEGIRQIDFMIGDADGFEDSDRRQAALVLGLSRLTLPHKMAHLMLAEQLYRVGTILAGHPYHRD